MHDRSSPRLVARRITSLLGVWGALAAAVLVVVAMAAAGTRLGMPEEHAVGMAAIAAFAAAALASVLSRRD